MGALKIYHLWFLLFLSLSTFILYISELPHLFLTGDPSIAWSFFFISCTCSLIFTLLFVYHTFYMKTSRLEHSWILFFHTYIFEISTFFAVIGYIALHIAIWRIFGWLSIFVCGIFYTTFIYCISII